MSMRMGKGSTGNKVLHKEALAQGQTPISHSVFERKGFPFI